MTARELHPCHANGGTEMSAQGGWGWPAWNRRGCECTNKREKHKSPNMNGNERRNVCSSLFYSSLYRRYALDLLTFALALHHMYMLTYLVLLDHPLKMVGPCSSAAAEEEEAAAAKAEVAGEEEG